MKNMGEKIRTQPQKYPDYVMDGETLYRNIPHRAGSKDVASWKMCGSPVLLASHAYRCPSPRKKMRDLNAA